MERFVNVNQIDDVSIRGSYLNAEGGERLENALERRRDLTDDKVALEADTIKWNILCF